MRLSKNIAVLLIFILSINCFAVAVSDNDGSAFITKAEFDSLKNNFQSQIDQYNSSIDAKIDAAIAAYLAGITVESKVEQVNLLEKMEGSIGKNKKIYWIAGANNVTNVTNYSEFLITIIYELFNKKAVGKITRGYASSKDNYDKGYNVFKLNSSKEVISTVKYVPKLLFTVSNINVGQDTQVWSNNMSSWSGYTNWGQAQDSTNSKYYVGYLNNKEKYDPDDSASHGSRSVSISYSQSDDVEDFVMCPESTQEVSIWDPNDKTASLTTNSSYPKNKVYESSIEGGTNADTLVFTTIPDDIIMTPDWKNRLPWVATESQCRKVNLNIGGISPEPREMRYGLAVAKASDDGSFKFKINAKPGRIGWYIGKATEYADIPAKQKVTLTEAKSVEESIDIKKGEVIWFIYLPDAKGRLEFESMYILKGD